MLKPEAGLRLPDPAQVAADVARALQEDIGSGDVSAALVEDRAAEASIICREEAVLSGAAWAEGCVRALDGEAVFEWQAVDGQRLQPGQQVCRIRGRSRALLGAERAALNFLQTLSATASVTARHVAAVAGTGARILDTRKTLPGLREAQKYAVRCGGGHNHRMGLYDAVMLKENHILAAGGLSAAVARAVQRFPQLPLIVEVETLQQLDEAIGCRGVTRILLDNFSVAAMRDAVLHCAGRVALEASGGLDLADLRAVAETGVDCISIGALTKNVRAVDLSMRLVEVSG
jgi:nicotinate-nucleotide pyrophosphorylase (carboxylating)